MRSLISCLFIIVALCLHTLAQEVPRPNTPATQPTTRSWLSGASTQPIIIPATQPTLERPMLSVKYDAEQDLLTVTMINKGTKPIVVDHDLVIPLYFTFFNERDVPIRMETATGPDPEPGDLPTRFVTLEPGQSLERVIDMRSPIPMWVSGSVNTFLNDEQVQVPFGRQKFRKPTPNSKIKRVQVVYAIMPADREAIQSFTTKSVDDLKLFTGAATAEFTVP